MDLFGLFCTSTVKSASQTFSQSFWQVDVPRAAATYPSLWHAGVALAAINQSVRQVSRSDPGKTQALGSSPNGNHYYVKALAHYNKSIQHLAIALSKGSGRLPYAVIEMAVMTNVLFFGIANTLDDQKQVCSLYRNFISLLETLRFGDDADGDEVSSSVERRGGVITYRELLALVLSIDGSGHPNSGVLPRSCRPWVIKVPCYESFTSVAEAHMTFLTLLYSELQPNRGGKKTLEHTQTASVARLALLRRFEINLDDLESTLSSRLAQLDRQVILYMRKVTLVHKIKEQSALMNNRLDVIREEEKLLPILDYIQQALLKSTDGNGDKADPPSFRFAHSFGTLLEQIVGGLNNVNIRRRGIALMRKWPYKEGDLRSEDSVTFYEAVIQHELTGPDRTRALQLQGKAISPTYENGDRISGIFDGTRDCECIRELYVCQDHKLGHRKAHVETEPHYFELVSRYELRTGLPYTRYYVDQTNIQDLV